MFGFSVVLLSKNEEALLQLKFDDILAFLKTRLFERYIVSSRFILCHATVLGIEVLRLV